MGKIHRLESDVRNKIAAGEVVERPASVVKELVENSIDARSTEIEIIVKGGGNASVQVVDNGEGMDSEDLTLAFDRHATSRISSAGDLENIRSLGFRGEALASIASVARVTARSTPDGSQEGLELTVTGGQKSGPEPASASPGTSITVRDLFFSVPARRKFLKSPRTEIRHIVQTVRRYALSHPDVRFRLVSDDKEVLDLGPDSLKNRISQVFDPTYTKNLIPVEGGRDPVKIGGYAGNLNLIRKRPGEQFLFINGRYVVDRLMNSAVYSAYEALIARGEYPFFILHLEIPPDQADVNVHPTKIEVRFRDQWAVYHQLKSAVARGLSDVLGTIPGFRKDREERPTAESLSQEGISFKPGESPEIGGVSTESVERAKEYVKSLTVQSPKGERVDLGTVWQVHNKYIVSQIKSGLVVIDQHAAHERVLFDKALQAMETTSMATQTLLFPQVNELPPDDYSVLVDLFPYLRKIGFEIKEFGRNTVLIEGVPHEMTWGNEKEILKEIIDSYQTDRKEFPSYQEAVAASFSCRAAVKAGDPLTREEMQTLVDRLFATKHPYYCPHGRPVIINLSLDELDRRFERT